MTYYISTVVHTNLYESHKYYADVWKAKIKSISRDFIYEEGESVYVQSIDNAYDVLTDYLDEMTDEEIEEKYNGLPWKEVIIVWVGR